MLPRWRHAAGTACLAMVATFSTGAQPSEAPAPIFFSQAWCPEPTELAELSALGQLQMNGCCIRRLSPRTTTGLPDGAWDAYRSRMMLAEDSDACTGSNPETRAKALEQATKDLKSALRSLPTLPLCAEAGQSFREPSSYSGLVESEVRRRQIRINATRARQGDVRIGDSECQLLASVGRPTSTSRTVNRRGTILHYEFEQGTAIVVNGVVESWSD